MHHKNPAEESLRQLLQRVRRIAVVGLSPKPQRDSHRVARYLQEHGYEIVPIYPTEDEILGQRVYRQVRDVPGGVDLVNVFRRSEELMAVTADVLASARLPLALWFQQDCIDDEAALAASEAGLDVIMDRCLMIDHAHLLGR
jgi:hypothetical protein